MEFILALIIGIVLLKKESQKKKDKERYEANHAEYRKWIDELFKYRCNINAEREIEAKIRSAFSNEKIEKEIINELYWIFASIPELSGMENLWNNNIFLVRDFMCFNRGIIPSSFKYSITIPDFYSDANSAGLIRAEYDRGSYENSVVLWINKKLKLYGMDAALGKCNDESAFYKFYKT